MTIHTTISPAVPDYNSPSNITSKNVDDMESNSARMNNHSASTEQTSDMKFEFVGLDLVSEISTIAHSEKENIAAIDDDSWASSEVDSVQLRRSQHSLQSLRAKETPQTNFSIELELEMSDDEDIRGADKRLSDHRERRQRFLEAKDATNQGGPQPSL